MTITWFIIRGSGLAAYAMLGIATIWGLLLTTKVMGRAVKAKGMSWFHESIGLAALAATAVHMVALGLDEFMDFGARELFIPGASPYRPFAVALGVSGFYGMALVALSFYVKGWIGQRAWRAIHYSAFGTFAATTAHGVMAGTDTANPVASVMYIGFTVAVLLLLVIRVASVRAPEARAGRVLPTRNPAVSARPIDGKSDSDGRPAESTVAAGAQ